MGAGPSREETPTSMEPEVSKAKEKPQKPTTMHVSEVPKTKEDLRSDDQSVPVELVKEPMEEPKNVPHKYEAIIKEADNPSSINLIDQIRAGIFLNNKRKKYWVDEKTGHNCFMLFARDLLIAWSENQSYWQWVSVKEMSDVEIEIASLLNVCWLEVHGRFETSYLTPGTKYEVVFVVMMELGYGWAKPVNLRLKLQDGSVQLHKECLLEKPKGQWFELKAGDFMARREQAGEMEFSLFEYEGGQWKRGLIIKGAIIRPKKY